MTRRTRRADGRALAVVALAVALAGLHPTAAVASSWAPVGGSGSTWAQPAIARWQQDVAVADGMSVQYSAIGSTQGRADFAAGNVDFAVTERPYLTEPLDAQPAETPQRPYASLPLVAGGTSLAYNLRVDGRPFIDLRLSGDVVAMIFTGRITAWNDPLIQADNPDVIMPARPIIPVVRSDASGSTAQFTRWLSIAHPDLWASGTTQVFPLATPAFRAAPGSNGVAGYVGQAFADGALTYVETSVATSVGLPSAKLLNASGYYVGPTADAVGIALLGAPADASGIQPFAEVVGNPDPRAYPLSTYASMLVPTEAGPTFTTDAAATLAAFAGYAVCAGQRSVGEVGDAPLPINLVEAASRELRRIPGAPSEGLDLAACANPTFGPGDTATSNRLLTDAPMPPPSARKGPLGVDEADLTPDRQRLQVTTTPGSTVLHLDAGRAYAGWTLRVGAFSDLVDLGRVALDGSGTGTVEIAGRGFVPGDAHRLFLAQADGTVEAWGPFTVPEADPGDEGPVVVPPGSGRFELVAPVSGALDLGTVRDGRATDAVRLGGFTVVDDRAERLGWILRIDVQDFVGPGAVGIPRSALGYAPVVGTLPSGVEASAGLEPGSGIYPSTFATGAPGSSTGGAGASFDADLTFRPPAGTARGAYRSTLTLTLISQ
ncbi:substrate-binding domain-containing protein [Agromyces sp. MMS24-JH15]|uniref:substrate-binding domain-containing protein n=1 Tax=Agromyces sp. MMS24-JH15 TaxID=3243765 RepID=UPI003749F9AF